MKVNVNVTKEKCPKCSHIYNPHREKNWYRCPQCKHVYDAGEKK